MLLGSWPGRLFLGATLVKLAIAALRLVADVPVFLQLLSSVATLGLAIAVGVFTWRLFAVVRRRLLWRVRRKLILSYIFIGVVPALLIIGFGLLGAGILSMNVSAYLFKDGYDDVMRNAGLTADAAAADIARRPGAAGEMLGRVRARAGLDYPGLSLAFVPEAAGLTGAADGPWRHNPVPTRLPDWVRRRPEGYAGTLTGRNPDEPGQVQLIVRAVRPVVSGPTRLGSVVVDVPIDDELVDRLYQQTGVRAGRISVGTESGIEGGSEEDRMALFGRSVAFFDSVDWDTGNTRRATVPMTYRLAELYERLSRAQQAQFRNFPLSYVILLMLAVVAGLFLIIEIVALIMGLALARSITSSVHELFTGTERVRQGDFTHRISISTKDQLGDLADSFNQMTASVENLLQTAAEKKRLEEELRIARQIQMSLLPRGPLEIPGLAVTALCVPAREVGGDYYDFFPLPGDRLGVLIADVAGKGTSAALYMAELKGLVLSLSQIYQSPRQMLLEANRILSENLDSRSFITMTYAVIDLARGTMTYARAGHTPLLYLPRHGPDAGDAQILTPNGMVLGLRIDGAEHKFAELLEEQELTLGVGDVIVLYTDGITEAMNPESDLFGDARLSRIVEQHGELESGELRERILREIEAFVGGADQHDDMTMILMKVRVREPARLAV